MGGVTSDMIADGTIGTADLGSGAVTSTEIADGTVQTSDLGQNGASAGDVLEWDGSTWTTAADTDTRTNVSDGGTQVTANATDIDFGSGLSATDDGDGSVTVDIGDVSPWEDASSDSDDLLEAPNHDGIDVDFVKTPKFGTATDTPVEGVVKDERFLRVTKVEKNIPQQDNEFAPNIVAGYRGNSVGSDVVGATVSGGGGIVLSADESNEVEGDYGTVAGGVGNKAAGDRSFIGGGQFHSAGQLSVVAGGANNNASGNDSSIGGGSGNDATARHATVPGGEDNEASGQGSFAAGQLAKAVDDNAFVWNDDSVYHSTLPGFSSARDVNGEPVTGAETFSVSAQGGVRFVTGSSSVTYISSGSTGWSTASARAAKTNVDPVDPEAVLDGIEEMEVATWEYEDEDGDGQGERHIGPMAGDFHAAVDVGASDDHINSINADGAAFAAIQGLSRRLDARDDRIEEADERIADLEAENERLRAETEALRDRCDRLEERLGTLEAAVGD
jgi:hypothetical protein